VNTGFTPSFSSALWPTQAPTLESVMPIAVSKNARVPEPDCGSSGTMVAVLVPPTWFHVVAVQV